MRRLILLILLHVAACDSDPAAPPLVECTTWENCAGGLIATTEVIDTAFGHAPATKYQPGDTMLLRIRLENRASIPTDSIVLSYSAAGLRDERFSPPFVLAPREVREIVDTAIVTFTFGEPAELQFDAWRYSPAPYFDVAVAARGTTSLEIARSGFSFDLQALAGPQVTFEYLGQTRSGVRVRHGDTIVISARIMNVYDADLPPISLAGCLWSGDHCFEPFTSTDASIVLTPGASADVSIKLVPDADGVYFDWYARQNFALDICAQEMFSGMPCESAHIQVVPNFEHDCSVGTAVVGVLTLDAMPDCGLREDGSAYRFSAREGERYSVSSPDAVVFLAPHDGVPDFLTRPREITIPADGIYYVVLLHTSPAHFILERIDQGN